MEILDGDRRSGEGGCFDLKCEPGNVYSIEMDQLHETIYTSTLRWECAWPDESERLTMQETARAVATAAAAESMRKRGETAAKVLTKHCEPLNRVYRSLNSEQQRAFLANVLHEVTRWRVS
jgi:hypothetical protein